MGDSLTKKAWSVVAALLVALGLASTLIVPVAQGQSLVTTVSVGANPYGIAYDVAKNEIFVSNSGSKTVSVISDATDTVIATISVGAYPFGVAYDPGRGLVFVTNAGANTVSVISDATNAVVATINVGLYPYGEAVDLAKGEVFVVDEGSNSVSVISDATLNVIATVTVGTYPYGAVYDVGKAEIFVTNSGSNTVSVISDATNAVVATVNVGAAPYGVTYDSIKGRVFVTDSGANAVDVISDTTNALVSDISVGTYPYGAAYDSAKGEVFITDGGADTVTVISDATNTVTTTVSVGAYPFGAAFDSGVEEVFVTDAGQGAVSILSDKSVSTTSLVCAPSTFSAGATSTCTATVTGNSPIGTVTFSQSGPGTVTFPITPSCTLSAGTCAIQVTGTTAGGVLIQAAYGGDTNNRNSSGTFTVTVTAATTTTSTATTTPTTTTTSTSSSSSVSSTTATVTVTVSTTVTTFTSATTITSTVLQSSSTTTITTTGSATITSTIITTLTCTTCFATSTQVGCSNPSASLGVPDQCTADVTSYGGSIPNYYVNWSVSPSYDGTLSAATCQLGQFYQVGNNYIGSCSVNFVPTGAPGAPVAINANYLGDSLNSPSVGSVNVVLARRGTSMSVSCTPKVAVAGTPTSISCAAKVFGFGTPTGNITLSQSGVGAVLLNKTSCILASGGCTVTMKPLAAGLARVSLNYMGDPNNAPSLRVAAITLKKGTTTTVLGCLPSSLAPGSVISCKATIFGVGPPPTGTVTWFRPSGIGRVKFTSVTCTLSSGSCLDSMGVITSGPFDVRAVYSGDVNNLRSLITLIIKASPTVTPNLSLPVVTVKHSVTDSAALSGGFKPTGSVSYEYFVGRTCSGSAFQVGPSVTVSAGLVPMSSVQFFNLIGNYSWSVVYSGDANNYPATGPCQSLTVNKEGPTLATTLSATTIAFGSTVTDSSVLSGATPNAGGTVIYEYFSGAYCAGTPTDVLPPITVAVGTVGPSAAQIFKSAGAYSWNAVYSGDFSNNGTTSACERLNVRGIPTITLSLSAPSIPPGGSVFAFSTLNGTTPTAGGTVQYELYSGGTCSGTATLIGTAVAVTNGVVPSSASQQFGSVGTYSWSAVYSGDANNNGATSACTLLTVVAPSATTSTTTITTTGTSTSTTTITTTGTTTITTTSTTTMTTTGTTTSTTTITTTGTTTSTTTITSTAFIGSSQSAAASLSPEVWSPEPRAVEI